MDPPQLAEVVAEGAMEVEAVVQAVVAREAKEAWEKEEEMEAEVRVAEGARAGAVEEEVAREDL